MIFAHFRSSLVFPSMEHSNSVVLPAASTASRLGVRHKSKIVWFGPTGQIVHLWAGRVSPRSVSHAALAGELLDEIAGRVLPQFLLRLGREGRRDVGGGGHGQRFRLFRVVPVIP